MQARPEAAAALLEALDDPDANVRFHAIEALGKLAPAAAVEPLAAIAESGDFFLAFPALDALARINDPAVAPRIVPLLRDELVGDQAAEALGQIGDEDAVAPLVAALDRPDASASSIVDALAAIHRRYSEMFGGGGADRGPGPALGLRRGRTTHHRRGGPRVRRRRFATSSWCSAG